jgi:hypothetical protein
LTASEFYQRAGQFHREGRLDEAITGYREALGLEGQFQPAWYSLGCVLEANGNHAAALACFQQAVSLAPGHGESHYNQGKAFGLRFAETVGGRVKAPQSFARPGLPDMSPTMWTIRSSAPSRGAWLRTPCSAWPNCGEVCAFTWLAPPFAIRPLSPITWFATVG